MLRWEDPTETRKKERRRQLINPKEEEKEPVVSTKVEIQHSEHTKSLGRDPKTG